VPRSSVPWLVASSCGKPKGFAPGVVAQLVRAADS